MRRESSQSRAHQNSTALRDWIKSNDLEKIPLNQFGTAARARICRILGIPRSSIGTNPSISSLFNELDAALKKANEGKPRINLTSSDIKNLLISHEALVRKLGEMQIDIDRLNYLEDTGVFIPPRGPS